MTSAIGFSQMKYPVIYDLDDSHIGELSVRWSDFVFRVQEQGVYNDNEFRSLVEKTGEGLDTQETVRIAKSIFQAWMVIVINF